jgi:hypothetical protein
VKRQLLLGALAGAVPAQLSWAANDTVGSVAVLPDAMTLLVLFALLFGAIRLDVRRSQLTDRSAVWQVGAMISMTAGSVFATSTVLLGVARLDEPALALGAYGFVTGFLVVGGCGAVACALLMRSIDRHVEMGESAGSE